MVVRASKWERQKNPDQLNLQPRDREIMKAVYSFRILSREQLQRLFNFSTRRMNMRLRKLYDHRYLSRSFQPTVKGSGKALYYLGPRGMTVVAEELGIDLDLVKQKRKATMKLRELFLKHSMELNDIRIAFSLSIEKQPDMQLESWINDYDCQQEYHISRHGKDILRQFRPDGYFRFWYQKKLYSFFIEHDRSTMTLGRFKGKVKSYLDFDALGYYRHRFGVKYFRVLVVTKTLERLVNLKKTVETVTDKFFWFTTMSQIQQNTVFTPIWQQAGRNESFSLINP